MITDTEGYVHLIEYLIEHLSLFEDSVSSSEIRDSHTVMSVIEIELGDQIISLCNQHNDLSFTQRNTIIGDVDTIVCDLEEVLSGVVNNPVSDSQREFIRELAILIKNLFDTEINQLMPLQ
jgi:hypothetical protein